MTPPYGPPQASHDLLHDVLSYFIRDIDRAISAAYPYVTDLLYLLLTLEIIFLGYDIAFGKAARMGAIIERIIMMGAIIFIAKNFTYYTLIFADGFTKILGLTAPVGTSQYLTSPGNIIGWGQHLLLAPYNAAVHHAEGNPAWWNKALKFTGLEALNPRVLALTIKGSILELGFILSFVILAVQMALAQIEFHLMILFAGIIIPFIAWGPLRFIGARAFGAVIGQALKVGIITFIVTLGINIITGLATSAFNYGFWHPTTNNVVSANMIALLAAMLLLVFLSLQAPSLAMSLLSGSPAFNASTFAQNMGAGLLLGSIASGFRGAARGVRNATSNRSSQSSTSSVSNSQSRGASVTNNQQAAAGPAISSPAAPASAAYMQMGQRSLPAPGGMRNVTPGNALPSPQRRALPAPKTIYAAPRTPSKPEGQPEAAALQSRFFLHRT